MSKRKKDKEEWDLPADWELPIEHRRLSEVRDAPYNRALDAYVDAFDEAFPTIPLA